MARHARYKNDSFIVIAFHSYKIGFTLFLFIAFPFLGHSQDLAIARKIIDTLSSKYFFGRGYINKGMDKAANFLANEFKVRGLQPVKGKTFLQSFSYPVNTFPGKM